MSTSSKSPRMVALVAWAIAKESLPTYAHKYAPKTYTLHQLFVCLVLKRFFKVSYRGIHDYLVDMPEICTAVELDEVPSHSTIQQANARLLKLPNMRRLLAESIAVADEGQPPPRKGRKATADSTGLEATRRSAYFTRRQKETGKRQVYHHYPKLTLLVDMDTHIVLSLLTGLGPKPDIQELCPLIDGIVDGVMIHHVYADAGFDSEANHRYLREEHGILTTIPPWHGRPSVKPPQGRYRRMMKETFHLRTDYGQHWQVETVNSMIKRNQGPALWSCSYWAQQREMGLAVLTHNIAIIYM